MTGDEFLDEVEREIIDVKVDENSERSIDTLDAEDFIDDVSATLIAERDKAREEAGEALDIAALWGTLDAKTKKALMQTKVLGRESQIGRHISPLFIDDIDHAPKDRSGKPTCNYAVPDSIKLWWVSKANVKKGDTRGYRIVPRKDETEQWVPNAKQYGSKKTIEAIGYVLCGMERGVWIRRKADEMAAVSTEALKEQSARFTDALENARSRLGLSREQAKQLDREGDSGFNVVKVADPEGQRPSLRSK